METDIFGLALSGGDIFSTLITMEEDCGRFDLVPCEIATKGFIETCSYEDFERLTDYFCFTAKEKRGDWAKAFLEVPQYARYIEFFEEKVDLMWGRKLITRSDLDDVLTSEIENGYWDDYRIAIKLVELGARPTHLNQWSVANLVFSGMMKELLDRGMNPNTDFHLREVWSEGITDDKETLFLSGLKQLRQWGAKFPRDIVDLTPKCATDEKMLRILRDWGYGDSSPLEWSPDTHQHLTTNRHSVVAEAIMGLWYTQCNNPLRLLPRELVYLVIAEVYRIEQLP